MNKVLLLISLSLSLQILAQSKIEMALEVLEKDIDLKYASIGFCAIDIDSNKIFAQRNFTKALIPASSMKVITTGSALALLGSNYIFKTYLEYSGEINNGTLNGNLYIRGAGDPSLASPIMDGVLSRELLMKEFVDAIKKVGIKKIQGAIIGDASHFDDEVLISTWQWGDIGNHYGAGSCGLNYHDNLYYINFEKNKNYGGTPKISSIVPKVPNLNIDNRVTSSGSRSGDNAYVFSAPFGTNAIIRGTIPRGSGVFDIKGAIPDPAFLCAHDLRNSLINSGVPVSKKETTQRMFKKLEDRTTFHTHKSPKLSVICKHVNERSRNMYCEAFLKTIGVKKKGVGRTNNGIAAVNEFWKSRGLDMEGFFMKDGCGLSARNGVSAKTFAEIMRKMYLDKKSFNDFYNQLAIAGRTGTLKNICRNSAAENNIRAKSGSMNRIRSYTGYVNTQSGKLLSFSIIVNNYSCSGFVMKKKLESLMIALAES